MGQLRAKMTFARHRIQLPTSEMGVQHNKTSLNTIMWGIFLTSLYEEWKDITPPQKDYILTMAPPVQYVRNACWAAQGKKTMLLRFLQLLCGIKGSTVSGYFQGETN